ncbi:fungal-specific transcription factor domain-containing protein [Xylogone sp. PMI_703]|nr:fungal-specific transcription factor domain-containing protein [Xylogone sp. PMI_703]
MKCNNAKPRCQNCQDHQKECIYAELEKRPRPSYARITDLEEENRLLRASLASLREQHTTQQIQHNNDASTAISNERALQSPRSTRHADNTVILHSNRRSSSPIEEGRKSTPLPQTNHSPPSRRLFIPDKETCYHGPTSAIYDEHPTAPGPRQNPFSNKLPESWAKTQLIAESAKQRQLEKVNFISGKLDFDGVDPELGMQLLSIHWSRQQSTGPVVYRTAFMRDMACAGPFFSKLLLNAIYFSSSKYTSEIAVRRDPGNPITAGWIYRQKVVDLLSKSFDKSSITTIQALLIMSSSLFSWCDEKSTSWLYAGMAYNMIIDLGIHVDASTLKRRFCEEEMEIRRRLYWAAYVVDKHHSLYQGRPACLRETDTELPLSFLDNYEELELFTLLSYTDRQDYPSLPSYAMTSFIEACKLSVILDKILLGIYSEKSKSRTADELYHDSRSLHTELTNWREALPHSVDPFHLERTNSTPLPNMLALLALYNCMIILLHRPFVSEGHLQSALPSVVSESFAVCSEAASDIDNILQMCERYFSLINVPYIISYATYVSATIHVRIAAQRSIGSDAHKSLQRCVDVLNIHQITCWSARRAKRIVDILISRMGVSLGTESANGTGDPAFPDIDIYEIMRTFTTEHQWASQPPRPHEQSSDPINSDVTAGHNSLLQPVTLDTHGSNNNIPTADNMTFGSDYFTSLYDPIFGFNGSTFDDFDIGFGPPLE